MGYIIAVLILIWLWRVARHDEVTPERREEIGKKISEFLTSGDSQISKQRKRFIIACALFSALVVYSVAIVMGWLPK